MHLDTNLQLSRTSPSTAGGRFLFIFLPSTIFTIVRSPAFYFLSAAAWRALIFAKNQHRFFWPTLQDHMVFVFVCIFLTFYNKYESLFGSLFFRMHGWRELYCKWIRSEVVYRMSQKWQMIIVW